MFAVAGSARLSWQAVSVYGRQWLDEMVHETNHTQLFGIEAWCSVLCLNGRGPCQQQGVRASKGGVWSAGAATTDERNPFLSWELKQPMVGS